MPNTTDENALRAIITAAVNGSTSVGGEHTPSDTGTIRIGGANYATNVASIDLDAARQNFEGVDLSRFAPRRSPSIELPTTHQSITIQPFGDRYSVQSLGYENRTGTNLDSRLVQSREVTEPVRAGASSNVVSNADQIADNVRGLLGENAILGQRVNPNGSITLLVDSNSIASVQKTLQAEESFRAVGAEKATVSQAAEAQPTRQNPLDTSSIEQLKTILRDYDAIPNKPRENTSITALRQALNDIATAERNPNLSAHDKSEKIAERMKEAGVAANDASFALSEKPGLGTVSQNLQVVGERVYNNADSYQRQPLMQPQQQQQQQARPDVSAEATTTQEAQRANNRGTMQTGPGNGFGQRGIPGMRPDDNGGMRAGAAPAAEMPAKPVVASPEVAAQPKPSSVSTPYVLRNYTLTSTKARFGGIKDQPAADSGAGAKYVINADRGSPWINFSNAANPQQDASGWKFHLSIGSENMGESYEKISRFLMDRGVQSFKIAAQNAVEKLQDPNFEQAGKMVTIYDNGEDWNKILPELEAHLKESGIKPSHQVVGDERIRGSEYIHYRNDGTAEGREAYRKAADSGREYNPDGYHDPYKSLDVSAGAAERQAQEAHERQVQATQSQERNARLDSLFEDAMRPTEIPDVFDDRPVIAAEAPRVPEGRGLVSNPRPAGHEPGFVLNPAGDRRQNVAPAPAAEGMFRTAQNDPEIAARRVNESRVPNPEAGNAGHARSTQLPETTGATSSEASRSVNADIADFGIQEERARSDSGTNNSEVSPIADSVQPEGDALNSNAPDMSEGSAHAVRGMGAAGFGTSVNALYRGIETGNTAQIALGATGSLEAAGDVLEPFKFAAPIAKYAPIVGVASGGINLQQGIANGDKQQIGEGAVETTLGVTTSATVLGYGGAALGKANLVAAAGYLAYTDVKLGKEYYDDTADYGDYVNKTINGNMPDIDMQKVTANVKNLAPPQLVDFKHLNEVVRNGWAEKYKDELKSGNTDGIPSDADISTDPKLAALNISHFGDSKNIQSYMDTYSKRVENVKENRSWSEKAIDATQYAIGAGAVTNYGRDSQKINSAENEFVSYKKSIELYEKAVDKEIINGFKEAGIDNPTPEQVAQAKKEVTDKGERYLVEEGYKSASEVPDAQPNPETPQLTTREAEPLANKNSIDENNPLYTAYMQARDAGATLNGSGIKAVDDSNQSTITEVNLAEAARPIQNQNLQVEENGKTAPDVVVASVAQQASTSQRI